MKAQVCLAGIIKVKLKHCRLLDGQREIRATRVVSSSALWCGISKPLLFLSAVLSCSNKACLFVIINNHTPGKKNTKCLMFPIVCVKCKVSQGRSGAEKCQWRVQSESVGWKLVIFVIQGCWCSLTSSLAGLEWCSLLCALRSTCIQ